MTDVYENESDCPTVEFYRALQFAFDHFNKELFDGSLPPCLISIRSSNRLYGYHHANRFIAKNGNLIDELGLNPGFFSLRPIEVTLSTLVHEMVHHWQNHFGAPTHSNPHNKQWVGKMEELGLVPSSNGLPGGKQIGKKVSHFIDPKGVFIQSCKRLLTNGYELKWFDRHAPSEHDIYEKQAQRLAEMQVETPVSQIPIKEIESPVLPLMSSTVKTPALTIYAPTPKREVTKIRMMCKGCGSKVSLNSKLHLICGSCKLDFEDI